MKRPFDFLYAQLDALKSSNRRRYLVPRTPRGTTFIENGSTFTNFGSNDYLGLASTASPPASTSGGGASSLVSGWTDQHQRLAELIAQLEDTESAVVFPSGYAACSGVVSALPGQHDLILSDSLNHASLIDGCRLSRAERIVYPHRDVDFITKALAEKRDQFDSVWIVTDGVFSMDADVAPLARLCDVADEFDAILIVDEAHSTGVLGESGSGVCEALGVKSRVPIRVGTLSKAIGSQGGFVAGPQVVVDYLINRCRSLIYSTSLSPAAVTAAIAGIRSIQSEPHRRTRVQQLSIRLRKTLQSKGSGFFDGATTDPIEATVPIVPIILGEDAFTMAASRQLAAAGLFVPAIRPPTVPEGTARLRISLSAAHSDEQMDHLLDQIERLLKKI